MGVVGTPTSGEVSAAANLTVIFPAAAAVDLWCHMQIAYGNDVAVADLSAAGWTLINQVSGGADTELAWYYKQLDSADVAAGQQLVDHGGTPNATWKCFLTDDGPLLAAAVTSTQGSTTTHTTPAITTGAAGEIYTALTAESSSITDIAPNGDARSHTRIGTMVSAAGHAVKLAASHVAEAGAVSGGQYGWTFTGAADNSAVAAVAFEPATTSTPKAASDDGALTDSASVAAASGSTDAATMSDASSLDTGGATQVAASDSAVASEEDTFVEDSSSDIEGTLTDTAALTVEDDEPSTDSADLTEGATVAATVSAIDAAAVGEFSSGGAPPDTTTTFRRLGRKPGVHLLGGLQRLP